MQRQIKFRVWNGAQKKWEHGPGQECNLFGEMILLGGFMHVRLEELNDCVALQYTGAKDRDGKEIYEGDIVNVNGSNREIVWRGCGFYCTWSDYALDTCWFAGGAPKVIGNKFDDPELLSKLST